jgi:hypothetical protein
VSGGFNAELTANIGAGTPAGIKITGYMTGLNDSLRVQMWDAQAGSPDWVTIGPWNGKASASNEALPFDAFISMVGVGANLGDIRLRLYNDNGVTDTALTSANIYIDQVFVEFNQGQSGYENGRIWINTAISNTNTVPGIDGTATNPVSTLAAAKTLSASTQLTDFHMINGSSITLATNSDNESYFGDNWDINLGGQSCVDIQIVGAEVTGTGLAASGEIHFEGCDLGTVSAQLGHGDFCGFSGTVTHTLAGDYNYHNCYSKVAGAGAPTFTKTPGQAITLQFRNWAGGITLSGLEASDTVTVGGTLGTVTLNGADAAVEIRGTYKNLVNNLTGSPTVNIDGAILAADVADILDDTGTSGVLLAATATSAQLVDDIMDENISKANHDVPNSLAKLVRQGGDLVQIDGQVSDVSPSTTNFDTNLTQADTYFDDAVLIFANGSANAGIGRPVSDYLNANGNFSFNAPDDWPVTPVNGDDFVIYANHVHPISQIQSGLATEAKQDALITTVGAAGAGLTDLGGMSTAMKAEILAEAVKVLTTQMTEDYAADGVAPNITQAVMLIQQILTDFTITGTSNVVKKIDGSTTAATMTLNDAASPTGSTRAS